MTQDVQRFEISLHLCFSYRCVAPAVVFPDGRPNGHSLARLAVLLACASVRTLKKKKSKYAGMHLKKKNTISDKTAKNVRVQVDGKAREHTRKHL